MIEDGARVDRFPMEMYLLSLSLSLSSVTLVCRVLGSYREIVKIGEDGRRRTTCRRRSFRLVVVLWSRSSSRLLRSAELF